MAGFMKSTLRLADRIAQVRDGASAAERSRIRALVIWTVLAVPIGMSLIFFAKGSDLASTSSICVLVGGSGMVLAIFRLRKTQNLDEASTIFIVSGVIGLGVGAWIDRPPALVPLIFLAATPVYFGLIVRWQKSRHPSRSTLPTFIRS